MLFSALAMLCSLATVQTDVETRERAVLLQAQGIGFELTDQPERALTLLRQAQQLAPNDPDIAFDLARVALAQHSPTLQQDAAPFMRMQAKGTDAQVLRAYFLAIGNEADAARTQIDDVLRQSPDHPEAHIVRSLLETSRPPQEGQGLLSARLRLGTEVDSNVQLIPQIAPIGEFGWRFVANGSLGVTPVRGEFQLDFAANARFGVHLLNRTELGPYDTGAGALWATLTWNPGTLIWRTDVVENLVFAGWSTPYFMNDVYIQSELRGHVSDSWDVGGYVLGGERQFDYDNPNNTVNDRTGPHVEAGVLVETQASAWTVGLRAGAVFEDARGTAQRVVGSRNALLARWTPGRWALQVAMGYEFRDYVTSDTNRRDSMLEPSFQATFAITPMFYLVGSYLFVDNLSSESPFSYTRHLGELGVEARW